ncbi:MAG: MarR family winged helix-turn-helix transcriptional regulator [Eubacteriales bacterium]|nr:MarR family winged helix-turn-helix transcriptional regulator [Eubacteriales bacterium]
MNRRYHGICHMQMHIGRMQHRIIEARVRRLGIHPSQHILLMHLSQMGRFPSQTQIAQELDVSPASVARTLKSLEANGYIERCGSDVDGRRNEIAITAKGEEMVRRSREIFDRLEAATFENFSDAELDCLEALLGKVMANLRRMEQDGGNAGEEEMRSI